MTEFNVAILVGSLRKDSFNLKLAKALIKLGKQKFHADILRIDDLPLFNQDFENNFPEPAQRLKQEIERANAVLIVTPEYNRSIPGPLKNAIDWASRPHGKNSFAGKPVATAGTSQGAIGTACAQHSLRPVLGYLDARTMGQPEAYIQFADRLIDEDDQITNDKTREFLDDYINKFITHVGKCASANV